MPAASAGATHYAWDSFPKVLTPPIVDIRRPYRSARRQLRPNLTATGKNIDRAGCMAALGSSVAHRGLVLH
jgi:hypothetical protein